MADSVLIQVGNKTYAINPNHLPPVGTRFTAHKHLSEDGGTTHLLEVVAHEWSLQEAPEVPEPGSLPVFHILIKTKIVG